jgi:hypothetical protein
MGARAAVLTSAILIGTGMVAFAQKVVHPEEFDQAMKTIGAAFDAVKQASTSKSYVDAKTPLALSRQVLASTRPFWETSGEPEAVKMVTDTLAKLDALDKILSTRAVEAGTVAAGIEDAVRACDACHAKYREGNEQTGYRIKTLRNSIPRP